MKKYKSLWQNRVYEAILAYHDKLGLNGSTISREQVLFETPPKPELGDLAFPMFPYAKLFKRAPDQIAADLKEVIESLFPQTGTQLRVTGPYLNLFFDRQIICEETVNGVQTEDFFRTGLFQNQKIMCEFSCPNTNKPLHLGHLRNNSLGMSVARIFKANGAEVLRVNLINDRGIHICKSMLAYIKFGGEATPQSSGKKSDHFVGDYYVRFDSWAKEDSAAEEQAQKMLAAWEANDEDTVALWKMMNQWAIEGIEETYRETGISFDKIYYESQTYISGKDEILKGLANELFYRQPDGSVWVDLTAYNLDKKVLLRGDGTSLYITQDIGTAISRYRDWPFERLIYVVASEQRYHFQVLFQVLKILGYGWADKLYHLSYGMVNLPQGKMKSREGTVVDADDLIRELKELAAQEIRDKGRAGEIEDLGQTAAAIALGALNFYLLFTSPAKDMLFNPAESISFTGNTGPYLQYAGARITGIFRKHADLGAAKKNGSFKRALLSVAEEWEIIKLVAAYPEVIEQAAIDYNPCLIANYLIDIARLYNKYYHENPVLNNDDADLIATRLAMAGTVKRVLEKGMDLIGVPFLERM